MAARLAARIEVWRDEDLLLCRNVAPGTPVSIGPAVDATVPIRSLATNLRLLDPLGPTCGYAIRLEAPLRGEVAVGQRLLRVNEGLLCDPRPEPLVLMDGDRGELWIDGLCLRFFIVTAGRAFRRLNPVDWRLGSTLAASTLGVVVSLAVVLGAAPVNRSVHRPLRLIAVQPPAPVPPALAPLPSAGARPARPDRAGRDSTLSSRSRQRRSPSPVRGRQAVSHQRLLAALARIEATPGARQPVETTLSSASPALLTSTLAALSDSWSPGERRARPPLGRPLALAPPAATTGSSSRLTGSEVSAAGPRREAIARVVARGRDRIQRCFERQLLVGGRPLQGQLLVRWTISASGVPTRIGVVDDSVRSPAIRRCLLATIRTWRFPPANKSAVVVYPFEFFVNS